ncbi:MAG: GtrA family protein [Deltaproteobacteria bacterium]|nr:GtrA family protein [Deltaproteobacteria bacterium]
MSSEPSRRSSRLPKAVAPLFSSRFLKFATVGLSGVVVNLAFLGLFADALGIHQNVSSALAIELSILSNFAINDLWTFRDHAGEEGLVARALKFHLVAIVGASVQWAVFVFGNVLLFATLSPHAPEWLGSIQGGALERYVFHPVHSPPETGWLKYLAQLAGIGVATFWNFFANFHWTWRSTKREDHS